MLHMCERYYPRRQLANHLNHLQSFHNVQTYYEKAELSSLSRKHEVQMSHSRAGDPNIKYIAEIGPFIATFYMKCIRRAVVNTYKI